MEFPAPLHGGTLVRRYKRFLADVVLDGGEKITAHCPNTGAMTGCAEPGDRVWLAWSDSKTRKYPWTWELVETSHGMACIHSARANKVVLEAVQAGIIPEFSGYPDIRSEVKYGEGSRADLVLDGNGPRCVVEVKSVTLCDAGGRGAFPDAVSSRASKHLRELQAVAQAGERAAIFFCALHTGVQSVRPAREIDPAYGEALEQAVAAGVLALAWAADISPAGISLARPLPVSLE